MATLIVDGVDFRVLSDVGWCTDDMRAHARDVCYVETMVLIGADRFVRQLDQGSATVRLQMDDGRAFEGAEVWQAGDLTVTSSAGEQALARLEDVSVNEA